MSDDRGVATSRDELFAAMAKIRMVHVPYKGTTPGLIDLLAGQLAIMAANMLQTVPYVRAGRLRALGVTTAKRVAGAPEIPTIAEGGFAGYESVQRLTLRRSNAIRGAQVEQANALPAVEEAADVRTI